MLLSRIDNYIFTGGLEMSV